MIEVEPGQLKRAVEARHACTATFIQSMPVKEMLDGATVWDGVVHVFKINGHPKANKAYAWSSPIEGSDKRRLFAVLHQPPITSPVEAVRAAATAVQKDQVECPKCHGTKKVWVAYDIEPGKMPEDPSAPDCPTCGGTGRIAKHNSN